VTLILAGVYARQSVITPLKRPCVYEYRVNCLVVGNPEVTFGPVFSSGRYWSHLLFPGRGSSFL
jgi:hypothetical protein